MKRLHVPSTSSARKRSSPAPCASAGSANQSTRSCCFPADLHAHAHATLYAWLVLPILPREATSCSSRDSAADTPPTTDLASARASAIVPRKAADRPLPSCRGRRQVGITLCSSLFCIAARVARTSTTPSRRHRGWSRSRPRLPQPPPAPGANPRLDLGHHMMLTASAE